ncbi:MAG TPA: hypothetical protein VJ179_03380 [Patescibacteria group bacterium]|nr:hypothetical protein [Patescibacteria group bacterium]
MNRNLQELREYVTDLVSLPFSLGTFFLVCVLLLLYPGESDYLTKTFPGMQPILREAPSIAVPTPSLYPVRTTDEFPNIKAHAAIVVDVPSAVVMYARNPRAHLLPASTTKIMTAVVALDLYTPTDVVTVFQERKVPGASMGLVSGERISVLNLLYGLLLASGNDAAEALARNAPGGRDLFIAKMNDKAKELNMDNTHFTNPTGFDEEDHYSSAIDLARLAVFALRNKTFADIVSTKKQTVTSADGVIVHDLKNLNTLLGEVSGVTGIKTGWTSEAQECLVTSATRNGQTIVTVVLGSENRFAESKELIEWAFANHQWNNVIPR